MYKEFSIIQGFKHLGGLGKYPLQIRSEGYCKLDFLKHLLLSFHNNVSDLVYSIKFFKKWTTEKFNIFKRTEISRIYTCLNYSFFCEMVKKI